jgi:hypothetical protein
LRAGRPDREATCRHLPGLEAGKGVKLAGEVAAGQPLATGEQRGIKEDTKERPDGQREKVGAIPE